MNDMQQQQPQPRTDVVVLCHQKILLVRRPDGLPKPNDFRLEVTDLIVPSAWLGPQQQQQHADGGRDATTKKADLVLETLYVSIDPAMRGWMSAQKSYLPPVELGSIMRASTVCRVVAASSGSLASEYPIGSVVRTEIVGVQSHHVLKQCTLRRARKLLTRLDHHGIVLPSPTTNAVHKLSYASYLGVLGTTGLTAYFGLLDVGKPKPSDVVLVSGAAGATGSIVAQIAKHVLGCQKVIGTAGSDSKCRWLESNGIVDVAINYKTAPSLSKAISEACGTNTKKNTKTKGVDLVFDNVGSRFLEAALSNLAMGARVVLCGAISQYNASAASGKGFTGPRNYMNLVVKRATMTGFVVLDYKKESPQAVANLVAWISEGKITCYAEDTRYEGIDEFYPALLSLFEGTNVGKVVLKAKRRSDGAAVPSRASKL